MVGCVGIKATSGSFASLGKQIEWKRHSALRGPFAKRMERLGNSEAIKQFRSMRMLSEFARAHRKMEEPKTLGQLLANEAKAKLDAAKEFFAGATLPL